MKSFSQSEVAEEARSSNKIGTKGPFLAAAAASAEMEELEGVAGGAVRSTRRAMAANRSSMVVSG